MSDLFFRIIRHLLPRARAWRLFAGSQIRQFFEGLSGLGGDTRDFIDDVYDDGFPQTTRALDEWEAQFDLRDTGLTTQERRDRLEGAWAATGGQSPRYIQDTLQAAGFPVYVHEWWIPASDPPVARTPATIIGAVGFVQCGEVGAECGEPEALCGNYIADGYMLVNRTLLPLDLVLPPTNSAFWPYVLYIAGVNITDVVQIPSARRLEFETLLLQTKPAQQWLGVMVEYV